MESMLRICMRSATTIKGDKQQKLPSLIDWRAAGQIQWVDISLVERDPENARTVLNGAELNLLSQSIDREGLLHPLVVRPQVPDDLSSRGILVSGHRRYIALLSLAWTQVPVLVRPDLAPRSLEDGAISHASIIAARIGYNALREDLAPVDRGTEYQRFITEREKEKPSFNYKDAASELNVSQQTVALYLSLLSLPKELKTAVNLGRISTAQGAKLAQWYRGGMGDFDQEQITAIAAHWIAEGTRDFTIPKQLSDRATRIPASRARGSETFRYGDVVVKITFSNRKRDNTGQLRTELVAALQDAIRAVEQKL